MNCSSNFNSDYKLHVMQTLKKMDANAFKHLQSIREFLIHA
jgi:hypothetical protein